MLPLPLLLLLLVVTDFLHHHQHYPYRYPKYQFPLLYKMRERHHPKETETHQLDASQTPPAMRRVMCNWLKFAWVTDVS